MTMSEAAKELKREYERQWRKKNPDKCRAIKARYWEKRLEKMKAEENAASAGTAESEAVQE